MKYNINIHKVITLTIYTKIKTIDMEIYFEDEQQAPLKKLQPEFYCDAVENNKVPCETQCYYCLNK